MVSPFDFEGSFMRIIDLFCGFVLDATFLFFCRCLSET